MHLKLLVEKEIFVVCVCVPENVLQTLWIRSASGWSTTWTEVRLDGDEDGWLGD